MNRTLIEIIVVLVLIVAGYFGHTYFEHKAVSVAIVNTQTSMEKQYQDKLIAANNKATQASKDLADGLTKANQDKDNAVTQITTSLNATINSLRQRPTRADLTSSVATAVASAKQACNGSQLFREDAEFLAREAARADAVVVERDYYYGQYEDARRTLAGQK